MQSPGFRVEVQGDFGKRMENPSKETPRNGALEHTVEAFAVSNCHVVPLGGGFVGFPEHRKMQRLGFGLRVRHAQGIVIIISFSAISLSLSYYYDYYSYY